MILLPQVLNTQPLNTYTATINLPGRTYPTPTTTARKTSPAQPNNMQDIVTNCNKKKMLLRIRSLI